MDGRRRETLAQDPRAAHSAAAVADADTGVRPPKRTQNGTFPPRVSPAMSRFVRTPPLKQAGLAYEDLASAERKMLEVWVGRDFVIWVLFGERGAAVWQLPA